jgi:hypothetical protein
MQQLEFILENEFDLKKDFNYCIRSQSMYDKKLKFRNMFPRAQGSWACFRFVYNTFPSLRRVRGYLKRNNLEPSLDYASSYLKQEFPYDKHIETMRPHQKILIVTYLAMYENLMPAILEEDHYKKRKHIFAHCSYL